MAHHDHPDDFDERAAGCCAVGCVAAMAAVTGFGLLCVWVVAPFIARLVAA